MNLVRAVRWEEAKPEEPGNTAQYSEEFVFDAEGVILDPSILYFTQLAQQWEPSGSHG